MGSDRFAVILDRHLDLDRDGQITCFDQAASIAAQEFFAAPQPGSEPVLKDRAARDKRRWELISQVGRGQTPGSLPPPAEQEKLSAFDDAGIVQTRSMMRIDK